MKRIISVVVLLSFFVGQNIFAQQGSIGSKKVYISFCPGYNFSAGSPSGVNRITKDSYINYESTSEYVGGLSIGKGLSFDLTAGYQFHSNLGLELGMSYLLGQVGGKNKQTYSYTYTPVSGDSYDDVYGITDYANMFRITPGLRFSAKLMSLEPYAVFGAVFSLGKVYDEIYEDGYDYFTGDELIRETTWEYSGGIAIGYHAKLGCDIHVTEAFAFFGEFRMINMSYAPKKGEMTTYIVDGEDQLPDMDIRDKEIEFVNEYTYNSSDDINDDEPAEQLKSAAPMGSMGINIGVKLSF